MVGVAAVTYAIEVVEWKAPVSVKILAAGLYAGKNVFVATVVKAVVVPHLGE